MGVIPTTFLSTHNHLAPGKLVCLVVHLSLGLEPVQCAEGYRLKITQVSLVLRYLPTIPLRVQEDQQVLPPFTRGRIMECTAARRIMGCDPAAGMTLGLCRVAAHARPRLPWLAAQIGGLITVVNSAAKTLPAPQGQAPLDLSLGSPVTLGFLAPSSKHLVLLQRLPLGEMDGSFHPAWRFLSPVCS